MIKPIITLMRKIVHRYDVKHSLDKNPIFLCTRPDTRNRYKRIEYRISEDKPQCPIFHDNRCCGCCNLAPECDHAIDCNCFGYTKSRLGGTDRWKIEHKASQYYGVGRCNEAGEFDWDYYNKVMKGE